MERVVVVDKGLREEEGQSVNGVVFLVEDARWDSNGKTYHQKRPHGIVQEHNGGGHEHGEADESVKLLSS